MIARVLSYYLPYEIHVVHMVTRECRALARSNSLWCWNSFSSTLVLCAAQWNFSLILFLWLRSLVQLQLLPWISLELYLEIDKNQHICPVGNLHVREFHPEGGQNLWICLVVSFIWTTMGIVSGSTATSLIMCPSFIMHSLRTNYMRPPGRKTCHETQLVTHECLVEWQIEMKQMFRFTWL